MTWSTPICLHKGTFCGTARRPDDRVPLELGDLAYDRSDGARGGRYEHHVTGLGIAILSKPTQAVSPGMPATPGCLGREPKVSSFCRLAAGALNRSRQPRSSHKPYVNARNSRRRTRSCTSAKAAQRARSGTEDDPPAAAESNTPSMTAQWKCRWGLRVEPALDGCRDVKR